MKPGSPDRKAMPDRESGPEREELLPRYLVGAVAMVCSAVLFVLAVLGPLGSGTIHYRTSQSGIWQTMAADLVNLVLIAPVLMIGGALHILRKDYSKYFLVLTPVVLMYNGLTIGIGQEWSDPAYTGNIEDFAGLFLVLIIGGLILLVGSVSMFTKKDAPDFKPKGLRVYVGVMSLFLVLFALMWLGELVSVIQTGDAANGAYKATPTTWWTIRYFDLGISIPLGFLGLFLLLSRPKQAYPLVLLFFGFFVTLGSAVVAMGTIMTVNHDPQAQAGALPIFATLALLSYGGLFYLVKDKLPRLSETRAGLVPGRGRSDHSGEV